MSFCLWNSSEKYRDFWKSGIYVCVECKHELFPSVAKFEHNSPWPAFHTTVWEHSLKKKPEPMSSSALKVYCGKCGNSLGHEFLNDGPDGKSRF
ncbi:methionine-R-sulfoxide reductase B1-like protein [Dinothrombium tinctorium]|uniref:peptide-methionine (R)-S-oxide reductase n=1 Tax=Dinothrombium tinctorium TaxID=1965070 RepID=A0A3S3RSP0_9ACAR|nr:methionine-R-sulfoxide reductase B1-like protein [Dinothrombium tinctorium]RWS05373.1 methionine-R-sulfoxide reductase B1-like protein [Dinothrombium tinctorium]